MNGVVLTISLCVLVEAMLIYGLAHSSQLYSIFFVFNFKITQINFSFVSHPNTHLTNVPTRLNKIIYWFLIGNIASCYFFCFNTECFRLVYYSNCPSHIAPSVDKYTVQKQTSVQIVIPGNTHIKLHKCIFSRRKPALFIRIFTFNTYLSSNAYMHLRKVHLQ